MVLAICLWWRVLALYDHPTPTPGPCMFPGYSVSLYPCTGVYGNFWIPCVPSTGLGKPETLLQGTKTTTVARLNYLAMVSYCRGFNTNEGFWRRGEVGPEILLVCSQESKGHAPLLWGIPSVSNVGGQGHT